MSKTEDLKVKEKVVNIIPKNNQVLIKKTIYGFPAIAITTDRKPNDIGDVKFIVEASSVDDYKKGDRLIIDMNIMQQGMVTKVFDIPNPNDYAKIKGMINELSNKDAQELVKKKTTYDIVEYLLIPHHSILAIIK